MLRMSVENTQTAKIMSLVFWKSIWITMRPYLIFVSGASGLVGLAFIENPRAERIWMAFFPLFFSYGLGQALTDCFQTDTDAISSPYRPMIKGVLSKRQVLSASLVGITLGILILTYLNPWILGLGILAVLGLLSYTTFKRTWWAGPFWNSWIVALLPIIGRAVERDFLIRELVNVKNPQSRAFLFAVSAIFFAYGNFVVMGYLKDINADRKTGYQTFPVVFGWRATAIYSDVLAFAAALFTCLALFSIDKLSLLGISIFAVALSINLYAQIKIHHTQDEREAFGPIINVVRSLILYCVAIIISQKGEWLVIVAVFYLLFEVALKYRPEKTQV
jgi:geranylgeranylglycerol-phosphate geranylgeranyltransferase